MAHDDDTKIWQHLPFNEGLPTRPDVDLLLKTWTQPKVGDRFEYETIEKLLNISRRDTRFHTVTDNWRRRVYEQFGVVVKAEPGKAFYAANADQLSAQTYGVLRFVGRKLYKQRRELAVAKIETEEQRIRIEHQLRLTLNLAKDAKKARMNVLPPSAPTQELPQLKPPLKDSKASKA